MCVCGGGGAACLLRVILHGPIACTRYRMKCGVQRKHASVGHCCGQQQAHLVFVEIACPDSYGQIVETHACHSSNFKHLFKDKHMCCCCLCGSQHTGEKEKQKMVSGWALFSIRLFFLEPKAVPLWTSCLPHSGLGR